MAMFLKKRDFLTINRAILFLQVVHTVSRSQYIMQMLFTVLFAGQPEPLMVKFADAGNKKRYERREWVDRTPSEVSFSVCSD